MKKQAIVIGLGQFGLSLARALAEMRVEVIGVDRRQALVQAAAGFADQAVCMDATEEEALAGLSPGRRDICVCAIGDESREGAILVTALLRQLGAPYIVARATDDLLGRILALVGAHEVVNPERAFGERFARRLVHAGILEEIPLGGDLVLSELRPRPAMVGRTLGELELPRRFSVKVLGVRAEEGGQGTVHLPDPERRLGQSDILIIVGRPGVNQAIHEAW